MEELIKKQDASKLQMLDKLQRDVMEIAEEQYCCLEEARVNITIQMTSQVETSEAENYGRARPTTNLRAKPTSYIKSTLPQKAMAQPPKSQLETRQDQALEHHVALLRYELFNVIPGTVNKQHGTASQPDQRTGVRTVIENHEVFDSCHLPQIPDTPIAGSSYGQKATFRSPDVRPWSVSSTPCLVTQLVSFALSRIPDTETSGKNMDSEAKMRPNLGTRCGLTPCQKVK